MDFLIVDTFTESLTHLTDGEQKLVKTTVFDLQMNPVNSDMSLHKLDDVFHPNTGEVCSDGAEGIACRFIGTVCNEDAWAFDEPEPRRIAVKVINHLGDAVKAFRAD